MEHTKVLKFLTVLPIRDEYGLLQGGVLYEKAQFDYPNPSRMAAQADRPQRSIHDRVYSNSRNRGHVGLEDEDFNR